MGSPTNSSVRRIDRYEVHEEFARGGMARVHLGRLVGPVGFTRAVAIKCLHPGYANDPSVVRMFIDEARIASRINHPNVVPIIDVLATGGELFLVMDYVRGASLARILGAMRAKGEIPPLPVVLGIMIQALSGLHAAHEARGESGEPLGIVHRDISPQNILVGADGVARILDFGVAKAASRLESTAEGLIKGKIAYMSPEQLDSGDVDRRSDIFSASAVLWELLAGCPLFAAGEASATVAAITLRKIEPPSSVNPLVPKELDAIVLRGLSRTVSERPQTALELVQALQACGKAASNHEVGAWVSGAAHEDLERNAAALAHLENAALSTSILTADSTLMSSSSRQLALSQSLSSPPSSHGTAAASDPPSASAEEPQRRFPVLASLISFGALAVVIVLLAIFARPRHDPATVTPMPTSEMTSSVAINVLGEPTMTTAARSVATNVAQPTSSVRPVKSTTPRIRVGAGRSVHDDCRVVNADGTFSYRPECLKK